MESRKLAGPPAGDIRPPPKNRVADITCKRIERLLDGLAERCGVAEKWKARKKVLEMEGALIPEQRTNSATIEASQRIVPMAPRPPRIRHAFGSDVYLDSQLRKRLAIRAAFRVAAPGIAVLVFILCAASSYESGVSVLPCLTRAAFAGIAAFVFMRLVGTAAANYWGNRG